MTTPTIPASADELEDLIGDPERMGAFFNREDGKPKPEFGELIKAYAKAQQAPDTDVGRQVSEQVQRELANFLRENEADSIQRLNLAPGRPLAGDTVTTGRGAVYNRRAPGAEIDHLFEDSVDYFGSIWWNNRSAEAQKKLDTLRNDYSSVVPADGGFLVPERLRSQLLAVSVERSLVRPRAMVVPMDSAKVPFPTIDSTSNADSVYGGIEAHWTEEGADMDASEAKFGVVNLEAKTLTSYTRVPNQLLADSIISFVAFLDTRLPQAIAFFEDVAFIRGTGVGQPLGWINAPAAVQVSKESGQPAGTIVWENIVKMFARMLPGSLGDAVWVNHIDTFPELATMALSVGTGGSAIWLNSGSEGPPMRILGRPALFTEKVKSVGTKGDLNLVDLSYYLVGDRQTMTAASSDHAEFLSNRTAYRVVQRVDGRPWLQSAITPNQGANTLSAFVQLQTRS